MKKIEYTQAELEKGMNYLSKHPEMIDSGMRTQIKSIISPQIKSTSYNGLLQSFKRYQPEKDASNGRLSDNRIKEIVDTTIRSALPSREATDYNTAGLTLSPEGQQRYLKESRAYRDAVQRYKAAVPGNVSEEFLRTYPTLSQLQAATRGLNGASLDTISKKWFAATGKRTGIMRR